MSALAPPRRSVLAIVSALAGGSALARPDDAHPDAALLRHAAVHFDQWHRLRAAIADIDDRDPLWLTYHTKRTMD